MILAYRKKTGCKQYVFESYRDLVKFFLRDCYAHEILIIEEFDEDGAYLRKFKTSTDDFILGVGVQLDMFRKVH